MSEEVENTNSPQVDSSRSDKSRDDKSRGRRNILVGEVVSDKMHKSLRVKVSRLVRHVRYGKYVRRASVFKAHDEKNEARVGDKVSLFETRALSKTKRWKLDRVVEKAKA